MTQLWFHININDAPIAIFLADSDFQFFKSDLPILIFADSDFLSL